METRTKPPTFAVPTGQPTSPPATPGSRSSAPFPPQPNNTSPIYKRMGLSMLAQSPPLEFIEPIGKGPQFHFTRPQSRDASSQASSASGRACATSPQESEDEEGSEEESDEEIEQPIRRVEREEFVLEELDSDREYDSDTEVLRPDHYEDAKSDKDGEKLEECEFIGRFSTLNCGGEYSSDEEEQLRRYRQKKKRWSAGIFKRSHSQSVGSDSDDNDSDAMAAHDVGSSARRLRRRVTGPSNKRSSLIFDDLGYPNTNNIAEVEEPEEYGGHRTGPPSLASDDGLDELPFWVLEDPMDVELLDSS